MEDKNLLSIQVFVVAAKIEIGNTKYKKIMYAAPKTKICGNLKDARKNDARTDNKNKI
jgi:hypothetical protein